MTDLCRSINRKIFEGKNGPFHFNCSIEQGNIYIFSPIDNEKVILPDNLKDAHGLNKM